MLDTILAYVDDVMSGAKTADNTFGRSLLDMVHSVPKMTPEEFEEMLNSNRKVCQQRILCTILCHTYRDFSRFRIC